MMEGVAIETNDERITIVKKVENQTIQTKRSRKVLKTKKIKMIKTKKNKNIDLNRINNLRILTF